MSLIINTNVMALNAQRNLAGTNLKLGRALEKLSSGLRINRAADDAAGLAISEKMRSQIRGMRQGSRNAQDGISMIQTAEGAMSEVHELLQRMRELAVQAGNSTLSTQDRTAIGAEIQSLKTEIDNIANRVTFNGLSLLTGALATLNNGTGTAAVGTALATGATAVISAVDVSEAKPGATYTLTRVGGAGAGTALRLSNDLDSILIDVTADATIGADGTMILNFNGGGHSLKLTLSGAAGKTAANVYDDLNGLTVVTAAGAGGATFRVGADVGQDISVTFTDIRTTNLGGGTKISTIVTDDQNVSTITKANTLLGSIDTAVVEVSAQRAKLGAAQNQMEAAVNSLGVVVENLSASESRIRDADIAQVSSELTARQIMQQAGVAVLSQANSTSQNVLRLLQQ
ncbi:MAG: flagellin [Dehalococcoidia bacterium]|nr:flagellin [Dehalococcoidia bacterium]